MRHTLRIAAFAFPLLGYNCSFRACDHPDAEVDCGGGIIVCGAPCPD